MGEAARGRAGAVDEFACGGLDFADGEVVGDGGVGEVAAEFGGGGEDGAGLGFGEAALADVVARFVGELEEAEEVGEGGGGASDGAGEFMVGQAVAAACVERFGEVDGVEGLAVLVVGEAEVDGVDFGGAPGEGDCGDGFEADAEGGAAAAFAGDDGPAPVGQRVDDQGVEDAGVADGFGERFDAVIARVVAEGATRRVEVGERDLEEGCGWFGGGHADMIERSFNICASGTRSAWAERDAPGRARSRAGRRPFRGGGRRRPT